MKKAFSGVGLINKNQKIDQEFMLTFDDETKEKLNFLREFSKKSTYEDTMIIATEFYSKINSSVYNSILYRMFKTEKNKGFFQNQTMNHKILDFKIAPSTKEFHEVVYKTASSERKDAISVIEDETFSNMKPELITNFTEFKLYGFFCKYVEETTEVPFTEIFEKFKEVSKYFPYFLDYIVSNSEIETIHLSKQLDLKTFLSLDNIIKLKIVLNIRYREDDEFQNDHAWNIKIKEKMKIQEVGYFSISGKNGIIGNFFIENKFRKHGMARAGLEYIKKEILPKNEYLIITTKHDSMKKIIEDLNGLFIGRTLPYISDKDTDRNEFVYVFSNETSSGNTNKSITSNQLVKILEQNVKDLAITPEMFQLISNNVINKNIPEELNNLRPHHLYSLFKNYQNGLTNEFYTIIGVTQDQSVTPRYRNRFTEVDVTYPHLVFKHDKTGTVLFYPLLTNNKNENEFMISFEDNIFGASKIFDYSITLTEELNTDPDNCTHENERFFEFKRFNNVVKIKNDHLYTINEFIDKIKNHLYGLDINPYRTGSGGEMISKTFDQNGMIIMEIPNSTLKKKINLMDAGII